MNTTNTIIDLAAIPRHEREEWQIADLHLSHTDAEGNLWRSPEETGLLSTLEGPDEDAYPDFEDEAPEPPEDPEELRLFLAKIGELILGDERPDTFDHDSIIAGFDDRDEGHETWDGSADLAI